MKSLTGNLQDLYKNLTIGDSGYSLRTRLANAKADYNPLAARVAAGDTTAYDDFANAAQTLIDLQREYSGSAPEYFALLGSGDATQRANWTGSRRNSAAQAVLRRHLIPRLLWTPPSNRRTPLLVR